MKKAGIQKLHPIESFGNIPATQGEIRIERLESRLQPKVPFPHRHDFFHFVYLQKGSGWHEVDFTKFPAKPGTLFFVKPGQVHSWRLGNPSRGYVLEFTTESLPASSFLKKLLRNLDALPESIAPENSAPVETLLELMFQEIREGRKDFRICLEHYLILFLIQAVRLSDVQPLTRAPGNSLVDRFRQEVEKNFKQNHSVDFYAKKLSVTAKHLTTQVTRTLGKSAGAIIQERCLIEAKRLLAYSELPIAEIAYELGYEDPNYFARFFRRRVALSPGRFRQRATHSVSS